MKLTKSELDVKFAEHGFHRIPITKQVIQWAHQGKKDIATITINRTENALILEHKVWHQPNENYGGNWKTVQFGLMSPLTEYIMAACETYQISLKTRHLNEDWSECHIIPGTNGGNVVDLKTRKVTKEKK